MKIYLLKLALLMVVAGLLTSGIVLVGRAEGASYTLADAARDAQWRQRMAERLKQLAIEADERRVR